MFAIVATVSQLELVIVTFELQRSRHLLIGQRPVAMKIVEVVLAILKEDSNRLFGRFADESGVIVPLSDVGKASDLTEDFMEQIGPFPRDRPRTDPAGTDPANGAPIGISGDFIFLLNHRKEFFDEKPCVKVSERIILVTAIAACFLALFCGWHFARIHKQADRYRHLFLVNEIVEHNRRPELAVRAYVGST